VAQAEDGHRRVLAVLAHLSAARDPRRQPPHDALDRRASPA